MSPFTEGGGAVDLSLISDLGEVDLSPISGWSKVGLRLVSGWSQVGLRLDVAVVTPVVTEHSRARRLRAAALFRSSSVLQRCGAAKTTEPF